MRGLIFILLFSFFAKGQSHLNWAISFCSACSGTNGISFPTSMATDKWGNNYLIGTFGGVVDFDAVQNGSTLISKGGIDGFVLKTDPQGNLLWAKSLGGVYSDELYSIVVTPDNAIIINGRIEGVADLDPGSSEYYLPSTTPYTVFLLKLNLNGDFLWAKKGNFQRHMAVDKHGNLYSSTGHGGLGEASKINKYNANGDSLWTKSLKDVDAIQYIAVDEFQNLYISGYFSNPVDFDPGPTDFVLTPSSSDIYLLKLNINGDFVTAFRIGGSSESGSGGIAFDSEYSVYLSGMISSTVDVDPGPSVSIFEGESYGSGFLMKLNNSMDFQWVTKIEGDGRSFSCARTNEDDQVIVSTWFKGSYCDIDPGPANFYVYNSNHSAYALASISKDGNFISGGCVQGVGEAFRMNFSNTQPDRTIMVFGSYFGQTDLDPSQGVYNVNSISKGVFIANYGEIVAGQRENLTKSFAFFPNPSTKYLAIINPNKSINQIQIFDTKGSEVMKLYSDEFETTLNLNIEQLNDGIYLVLIRDKYGKVTSQKFIKSS